MIIATISVPPVDPPCEKHRAMPTPARMPPRMTARMRSRWRKSPAGSTVLQKFSPTEIIITQKTVLMPKFHPTMNPAKISRMPLMTKAMVPIWIEVPSHSLRAVVMTNERPVAPPPVPWAGRTHPIHPNE